MKAHPELILGALQEKELELFALIEDATHKRDLQARDIQRQAEMKNPFQPDLKSSRPIRGAADAPITIIEYGDFECPFCGEAHRTVQQVLRRYEGQIRFIHKHNPISEVHPMAFWAAHWFEAIAALDPEKAWRFHDRLYEQQSLLKDGDVAVEHLVTSLGLNPEEVRNMTVNETITLQIQQDRQEARSFGFTGTPVFLVNGVSIRGAYPEEEFIKVIELVRKHRKTTDVDR